jgi:hypothetical protein
MSTGSRSLNVPGRKLEPISAIAFMSDTNQLAKRKLLEDKCYDIA